MPRRPLLLSLSAAGCLLGAAPALLTACTVYAPMQPTVSTIRQAGQVELTASLQPSLRLEVGAVVSPLPHVLLTAAGTYRPRLPGNDSTDRTYFTTRQWEAGAGTYWALGPPRWLLTGLGGYGYARTDRMWGQILGTSPDLHARYGKWYGQVGLHGGDLRHSGGVVYRLTRLQFDALYFDSRYYSGTVDLGPLLRHEVLFYYRNRPHYEPSRHWQIEVQSTLGLSFSGRRWQSNALRDSFEQNRPLNPVLLASLGIVFGWQQRPGAAATH